MRGEIQVPGYGIVEIEADTEEELEAVRELAEKDIDAMFAGTRVSDLYDRMGDLIKAINAIPEKINASVDAIPDKINASVDAVPTKIAGPIAAMLKETLQVLVGSMPKYERPVINMPEKKFPAMTEITVLSRDANDLGKKYKVVTK